MLRDATLHRSTSLAEESQVGAVSVSFDGRLSAGRALWIGFAAPPSCGVSSDEHRGGVEATKQPRVCSFPECRRRISGRNRIFADAQQGLGISITRSVRSRVERGFRDCTHAQRAAAEGRARKEEMKVFLTLRPLTVDFSTL